MRETGWLTLRATCGASSQAISRGVVTQSAVGLITPIVIPSTTVSSEEAAISDQVSYGVFRLNERAAFAAVVHCNRFLCVMRRRAIVVPMALNASKAS